jgi:hypothetical protein
VGRRVRVRGGRGLVGVGGVPCGALRGVGRSRTAASMAGGRVRVRLGAASWHFGGDPGRARRHHSRMAIEAHVAHDRDVQREVRLDAAGRHSVTADRPRASGGVLSSIACGRRVCIGPRAALSYRSAAELWATRPKARARIESPRRVTGAARRGSRSTSSRCRPTRSWSRAASRHVPGAHAVRPRRHRHGRSARARVLRGGYRRLSGPAQPSTSRASRCSGQTASSSPLLGEAVDARPSQSWASTTEPDAIAAQIATLLAQPPASSLPAHSSTARSWAA